MKERTYYLDIARVLSMLCVIIVHVGAMDWYTPPYTMYPWFVLNLFDCLSRFCVPVFMMISGYLFLNPDRELDIKKLFGKNIVRMLTAFLFWSFCYAIITSGFATQRVFSQEVVGKFFKDLFAGHYHMWYMYVIVGLYIITPALRAVAANEKAMKYFLVASFVISYLVPTIQMLPGIYLSKQFTVRLEVAYLSGYSFYYLFGYYMGSRKLTDRERKWWYGITLSGLLLTILFTSMDVMINQYPNINMHEFLTFNVAMYACGMFFVFKDRFSNVDVNSKWMKTILWFSKLSFGIYMVHDFPLIILKKIGLTTTICTPFISVPLLTLLDLAVATAVIWTISKIPVLKKYII